MNYDELSALDPSAYLEPEVFRTEADSFSENLRRNLAETQYQKGLQIGKDAKEITIAINSVWGATMRNGASLSSYEGIGYHAGTADLLRGFLDSGARIVVYRFREGNVTETVIKP